MSKSFMILVALLAVSSIASATEMKSFTLGFYENQERFFPIESFTGTSGCTYNFGELDVKDVNAPFPRYISPHNMVKVGTDALKRIEINVTNMRTVCRNNNCSVYTFDSDGKIYSRFGNLTTNGSWLVEGDRNLSALKEIETDKFVDLVNSNNVTFTVSHTADNNTRFILGLAPGDSTFDADETNFIVSGVVPDSDIEYIKHAGVDRTLLLLEKGGKATYITVINFQERASAQTPKPTPIDAKTLGLTTIYALEADQYVQELLYVFADSAIIAYNVSDVTNWKVVVMTNITITPEAAAKGPNLIERKANVLALRCGGNSSVLIFDTSKPTILTITGFLSTEGANEYDIDFSDRLNYLYISRPGDVGKVKLTIYDMRRLSTPQNAVNAKRFEAQFNVSTYSPKLTIMSVANLDDSSDMIFWYGVVGDIYKFYDIAGVNIIVGDETEILDQVTLTTGPRPGSYVYNYSFIATPIACQTTTDYNITISLEFLLPMRQLIAVKEKVNSTAQSIYPGVFFNGPTQTLLVLPNEDEKYKDNFKVEIINPLETKTDIVRLWNPTTDILVDEFTERGRAFLLLKSTPINGATVKADMEYRIINVNMTREVDDVQYTLNQSGSAWDDVEACFDLFAMKDIHDAHAFVLSCTLKSNSSLQGIFTYTNVSSDFLNGTQDLHYSEFQTGLNSYSPFAVDLDSNVLFQVFDSDENNGIFAASTFITLPGITNETNYTVKYSDIEGPNGEKVTQASIVNFDVVQFDNDNNFHFGLAATTTDYKLILAFVGANGTSDAQVYDLTQTSIFKQDVIFEKPFFNKVEWVNDDCLKNNHHSATLLLISPNFYSYTVKLALGADKKPTLQVINAFAYFPAYRTVDAKYDSCTNTFVTLTNAAEKFTTPNCFMSVYPSNVTNASTFSFNSESYTIIEPVSYRNLPCPDILKAKTLGSERINNITVISFSTNGEVASVQATLAFELQIKNISLPANLTNVTFALDVTAINSFSTAKTAIQYPFGKQTPTPTPTPDPDPTPTPTPDPNPNPNPNPTPNPNPNPSPDNNDKKSSLTWLWILLGIVGVILVIAAVVWVLRNRKDNEEALLDGKNDMSLQHA